MFPYIPVFGFSVPSYAVLSFVGLALAAVYVLLVNRSGRLGTFPTEDLVYLLILAPLGAIVGGKILYVLVTLPQILQMEASVWQDLPFVLSLLFGGMVFYGGLFGAIFSVVCYCRHFKLSLRLAGGICTPAIPLFHLFGRTGCLSVGCCWGVESGFGYSFHQSPVAPNGVLLFPTQGLEMGANFFLFVLLAILALRWGKENAYKAFPLYLILYSTFRFFLEFFRGDTLRGVWLFSTSQWISLGIWAGLAVWYLRRRRAYRK